MMLLSRHLPRIKNLASDERAFTLVESMIGIAVLVVGILGTQRFFTNSSQQAQKDRSYSSRDKVLATVRAAAGMPSALRNSVLANANNSLFACMSSNPSFLIPNPALRDCNGGPNATPTPLMLFSPIYTIAIGANGPIAGPNSSEAIYYNGDGEACDPSISNADPNSSMRCVIQAWAEFTPQCPPTTAEGQPANQCDVAELIQVTYHVEPIPTASSGGQSLFSPITGTVTQSVQQVSGLAPSIDTVLPIPSPMPSPASSGTSSSSSSQSSSNPSSNSQPTLSAVNCPDGTVSYGSICACPFGMTFDMGTMSCTQFGI
jgi:type II secretory pathway pseudopilin PulG